jgi:hypothetical protein
LCEHDTDNDRVKDIIERLHANGFEIQYMRKREGQTENGLTSADIENVSQATGSSSWNNQALPTETHGLLPSPSHAHAATSNESTILSQALDANNPALAAFESTHTGLETLNVQAASFNTQTMGDMTIHPDVMAVFNNGSYWAPDFQNGSMDLDTVNGMEGAQFADIWWENWINGSGELDVVVNRTTIPAFNLARSTETEELI